MDNEDVKEQLIMGTMDLLRKTKDASKVTSRQIVAASGSTLGMINYYFDSKDALVETAVSRIIAEKAAGVKDTQKKDMFPEQKLFEYLVKVSDTTVEYADYTRPTIPYVLLEKVIEEPYHLLPMVKECFGNERSEVECRMIAYQLTTSLQMAFYRSSDLRNYIGMNVIDKEQRIVYIRYLLGILGINV